MIPVSALVDVASHLASPLAPGVATLVLASARDRSRELHLDADRRLHAADPRCTSSLQWLFAFGLRPPYSRASSAVLGFLRDVCEPFLRIFRRLLPSFGGLDLSPIVAILVLVIVNRVVVEGLIHG